MVASRPQRCMIRGARRRALHPPCRKDAMNTRDPHNRIAATEPADAARSRERTVHDVNQMLTVITGRAGLLLQGTEDTERVQHLRAILLAADDAAAMLQRLQRGAVESTLGRPCVSLSDVTEQARLLVWPTADDRYRWRSKVGAELTVAVPAQVLREVLANLLLNAREAMPGGGEVTLSAESAADRVRLRVADNGPGLPQGDPERVFTWGVSEKAASGRGVGLAGCRQLLASAGGALTAAASAGSGAVFSLDLPVGQTSAQPVAGGTDGVPAMDVLVVEDETGVREMLHDVLTDWGCRVQTCRDGATALAQYRPGSAAVALIDQNLPGLDGLELASRLRAGDPCLSIVMVTGWHQDDRLAAADPAVVDQRANKPLALASICDILNQGHRLHLARRAAAEDN